MAGTTVAAGRVVGSAELQRKLLAAGPKKLRPAAKAATGKAIRLAAKEAKAHAPRRSGSLAKAVGSKVAARRDKAGFVGVAGPRRDSDKAIAASVAAVAAGRRKRALKVRFRRVVKVNGRDVLVNPVKYAHLVEFGRAAVTPKGKKALAFADRPGVYKRVKAAAAKPFMAPAYRSAGPRMEAAVAQVLREAVRKLGQ